MRQFAVFGNPIGHSKSPRIHTLFAEQTGISLSYKTALAPMDGFESSIKAFFASGADGANVTMPFKEQAYAMCVRHSERAALSGAVNTLKPLEDGHLFGDNTDGIGLLSDLQQLKMIAPGNHILLVGAGGAARGVLYPLLTSNCKVTIVNRTYAKALKLVELFKPYGDISAMTFSELKDQSFDLVINATSSGAQNNIPPLPGSIINPKTQCYDMFYQKGLTPFLRWAEKAGADKLSDGLGMLVWQAAYAFKLWNEVLPDSEAVLVLLRKELPEF